MRTTDGIYLISCRKVILLQSSTELKTLWKYNWPRPCSRTKYTKKSEASKVVYWACACSQVSTNPRYKPSRNKSVEFRLVIWLTLVMVIISSHANQIAYFTHSFENMKTNLSNFNNKLSYIRPNQLSEITSSLFVGFKVYINFHEIVGAIWIYFIQKFESTRNKIGFQ